MTVADNSLCYAVSCEVRHACRRYADSTDKLEQDDSWEFYAAFEPEKGADCCGFVRQKFIPIGALIHEWSKDPGRAAMIKPEDNQ